MCEALQQAQAVIETATPYRVHGQSYETTKGRRPQAVPGQEHLKYAQA